VRITTAVLLALLATSAAASDDLTPMSDDFSDASTLSQWKQVYIVEGWSANQLELQDINTTRAGRMVMMPFTSTWYNDYRGVLTFKEVTGDFVVTADVESTRRNGVGAPTSNYSLAGLMVRAPRQITQQTWRPGGENYVFLALGAASNPGVFQFEVKTTTSSVSTLFVNDIGVGHGIIQVARIGSHIITLRNIGGTWVVHRRFFRPDLPLIMQVGMTTYTDFATCSTFQPFTHNSTVLHTGNADLLASYDYIRYQRPHVPAALVNANLSDASVSDATVLTFLGANLDAFAPPPASRHRAVRH
jgi:hypothetical protein